MKLLVQKYILIAAACALSIGTRAQNIPSNGSITPIAPSRPMVVLPPSYGMGLQLNLTRTFVPMRKISDAGSAMFTLHPAASGQYNCKVATQYVNGWGDVTQVISRGNDATVAKDIVIPYDLTSNKTHYSFLPYAVPQCSRFQHTPFTDQAAYYHTLYPAENGWSFGQHTSSTPASVPTEESYSAGSAMAGNAQGTVEVANINDGTENIIIYNVTPAGVVPAGFYPAGTLMIKSTNKVQHAEMRLYIDKDGRTICRKTDIGTADEATTYNVYNDIGQLAYTVTPLAYKRLSTTGEPFDHAADLMTITKYNELGEVTSVSKPSQTGANVVVYDKRNRVVLTQTPLLNAQGLYKFNIYDNMDRIVASGLYNSAVTYDMLQTQINDIAFVPAPGTLLDYIINGAPAAFPAVATDFEIDNYNYYDTYRLPATFSNIYNGELGGYGLPYLTVYKPYMVTNGLLTGSLTRVKENAFIVGSDKWVTSTVFYDKEGHVIQIQSLNPKAAESYAHCIAGTTIEKDIEYIHYNFLGNKVVDILEHHEAPGTIPLHTKVYNNFFYDYVNGGRLVKIMQSINDGTMRELASYKYDELGKVQQKSLGGVELQNYDYNIRGQLTGINRDYVNDQCNAQAATSTFGCILSYDFGFDIPRYDGLISGMVWRGASHTMPLRSYGYEYAANGRLNHAEFRELSDAAGHQTGGCGVVSVTNTWNKTHTDFTASNMKYDLNGNLVSMNQRGNSVGGPIDMDLLNYHYRPWSNQLAFVEDAGVVDASLPDFKDATVDCNSFGAAHTGGPTATTCDDYAYDANGNLTKDANKKITLINYNENDQPQVITFENGSIIKNTYDASGRLVTKAVHNAASTAPDEVYSYCGLFTYKNDILQYATHDEGRVRFDQLSGLFTYDYFVKDHIGNIRTVVTGNLQNTQPDPENPDAGQATTFGRAYYAGHELNDAKAEDAVFSNIDKVRDVKPATQDSNDVWCARLNSTEQDRMIGTAIMLHVMAGDSFSVTADAYYDDTATADYQSSGSMLTVLLATLTGPSAQNSLAEAGSKMQDGAVITNKDYDAYDVLVNENTDPTAPRAYINYLVFDENMVFKPELSGAVQVNNVAGEWRTLGTEKILVKDNGYVDIYLSNGSGKNVYMDHMNVVQYHGSLLQENHYYPYGLTVTMGESSTALKNKFKFQGKEIQEDLGQNMYDFTARNYDQQIGRFCSIDPAGQFSSGYIGMGNNPANMIDPSGCSAWSVTQPMQGSGYLKGGNVENHHGKDEMLQQMEGWVASLGTITFTVNATRFDFSMIYWCNIVGAVGHAEYPAPVTNGTDKTTDYGDKKGVISRTATFQRGIFSVTIDVFNDRDVTKPGEIKQPLGNGMDISVTFTGGASTPTLVNWLQVVTEDYCTWACKPPYTDPRNGSGEFGTMYYRTDEKNNYIFTNNANFDDAPGRDATANSELKYELTLIGIDNNGHYIAIGTLVYGFKVNQGIVTNEHVDYQPTMSPDSQKHLDKLNNK